jgi:hypothetical protein
LKCKEIEMVSARRAEFARVKKRATRVRTPNPRRGNSQRELIPRNLSR